MKPSIRTIDSNQVLIYPFQRGIEVLINIESTDIDFTAFSGYKADIKTERNLSSPSLLTLTEGNGLTITQNTLQIKVTQAQSKDLEGNTYILDVKAFDASNLIKVIISVNLIKHETITNMQNGN